MNQIYEQIHQETKERFERWYGDVDFQGGGSCLYWAQCAMGSLLSFGYNPLLQAGSCFWPLIRPEEDDGVRPTHFAFQWDPTHPLSVEAIEHDRMPEMHVWVMPDFRTPEIVLDFSTYMIKPIAVGKMGLKWTAPDPPEYLWGSPPAGVRYVANPDAYRQAIIMLYRGSQRA